jgi:hypothetical protein
MSLASLFARPPVVPGNFYEASRSRHHRTAPGRAKLRPLLLFVVDLYDGNGMAEEHLMAGPGGSAKPSG